MDRITYHKLPEPLRGAADIFEGKEEELCEMGARTEDGDLGLTMQKGPGALFQLIRNNEAEGDIGRTLVKTGMKMAGLIPSTTGALISSGIMGGGKAIGKEREMGPKELTEFLASLTRGIAHRGKCQLGDRIILDVANTGIKKAQEACVEGADMGAVFRRAVEDVKEGVKATKDMLPKYGEAAVFSIKAKNIPGQGVAAGQCFLEELGRYFLGSLK